jgi:hypothetical protein
MFAWLFSVTLFFACPHAISKIKNKPDGILKLILNYFRKDIKKKDRLNPVAILTGFFNFKTDKVGTDVDGN